MFISDIQKHLERSTAKREVPSYEEIVECERKVLKFFNWDLGFILVFHFIEMFLANGCLFESEE